MAPDDLRARLRTAMATAFETDIDALPPLADTDSVRAWDSLGHLMLIDTVEDAFGVTFAHAEMVELLSEAALAAKLGR